MGISEAIAVWIPSPQLDPATIEQVVRDTLDEGAHLGANLWQHRKATATMLVIPCDSLEQPRSVKAVLAPMAKKLARKLKRRVYAVDVGFGSGDWIEVTAFSASGAPRWKSESEQLDEPMPAKTLDRVAAKLGMKGRPSVVDGMSYPYWRMMSELSKAPFREDLIGLGLKPALDDLARRGWSLIHSMWLGPPEAKPQPSERMLLTQALFRPLKTAKPAPSNAGLLGKVFQAKPVVEVLTLKGERPTRT